MDTQKTAQELISKHLEHCKDDNHLTAIYYAHQEALKEAMENMRSTTEVSQIIFWMNVGEVIASDLNKQSKN